MFPLLPLFGILLSILITFLLNSFGHWSWKSLEHVRLDALTLSICHHRLNFFKSVIEKNNKTIRSLQTTMDTIAAACSLNPLPICRGAPSLLKTLSQTAQTIQTVQDTQRTQYFFKQRQLLEKLKEKNELNAQNGKLIFSPFLPHDGFQREKTTLIRKGFEKRFNVLWPQKLETKLNFNSLHVYYGEFLPVRLLAGVAPRIHQTSSWRGLKVFRHKTKRTGKAVSRSQCQIIKTAPYHYVVKRIL